MTRGIALLCLGLLASCVARADDGKPKQSPTQGAKMKLTSTAFTQGSAIPRKHSCEGGDVAPALTWSDVPEQTRSLALIVDDPDAPDPAAPKTTWVHWVLLEIPKVAAGLPEGGKLPPGTREGLNDWKRTGYGGPCPPIGRHRYFFKLYALDANLDVARPTKAELEAAMKGHVLARAELMGTYQKEAK
jgi:Raf kinase inhibitor-like YbhB/YbcL family protein